MKKQMLIFFSIVLLIYSFANYYLYMKGLSAMPSLQKQRLIYSIIFFSVAAVFIVAKILESRHSSILTDVLNIIGGFWLAFMLYGFLFFLLSDIILLFLKIIRVMNPEMILSYKRISFIITISLAGILIIGGFINAIIPVVTEYNITINKPAGDVKELRIAAASDIHLGSIIRKRSIKKLSSMLKQLKPDLVLLLGDIVDGEIGPVLRGDLLQYFTCPDSKYGMLAISGNHEFIGGASRTIPYIESKGIKLLKDEIVVLDGGIQIIGRNDRDSERFYGKKRMPLSALVQEVDSTKPIILLDHQPFNYDETVNAGIDLELSGHTHNGQMWPLNYITAMIYELSYGYLRKGNSQFIVSSGYGLWGPRVRSASRSEVLLINITFNNKPVD
ncbi:MAG TPA: metallophosphoesterase [Bacteroidales bacterium]|nr:metallophosphoesterase [Bacteroidales bacterium]